VEVFLSVGVIGLLVGFLYALVSMGLTLTYGVLRVVNFAHGEFMMAGMYATWVLQRDFGLDPYLSWPISTAVVMVLSLATYQLVIRRTIESAHAVQAFVTLGLSLVLQNLALFIFSSHVVTAKSLLGSDALVIGPLRMGYTYLASAFAAIVVTVLLYLLMQKTHFGRAVRATAQNAGAAKLQGIDTDNVYRWTFVLGTGLAGFGGAIFAPIYSTFPTVGFGIMLVAFVIVVLGGMGSLPGALIGALLIGVVEAISAFLWGPSARQIVYFLVFVAILIVRPRGLLGIKGAELVGYK
jgi:branched-chain amino acid transport system permease protein